LALPGRMTGIIGNNPQRRSKAVRRLDGLRNQTLSLVEEF
jgi:hypothetical protein